MEVGIKNLKTHSRKTHFGKSYDYDIYNNLTSVSGAGIDVDLAYDAKGRLAKESVSSGTGDDTQFAYAGTQLIAEYNGANTLQRRFVHGPGSDEPIVWYEGTGTATKFYMMADHQGSIIGYTDASGTVTDKNSYSPEGVPADTNVGRFGYTGQMWLAEAELYHYKARAYDPDLGRFLQGDPIGYGDGLNIYAYVGGDAVNRRDPSGTTTTDIDEVITWGTLINYGSYTPTSVNSGFHGSNGQSSDPNSGLNSDNIDEIIVNGTRNRRARYNPRRPIIQVASADGNSPETCAPQNHCTIDGPVCASTLLGSNTIFGKESPFRIPPHGQYLYNHENYIFISNVRPNMLSPPSPMTFRNISDAVEYAAGVTSNQLIQGQQVDLFVSGTNQGRVFVPYNGSVRVGVPDHTSIHVSGSYGGSNTNFSVCSNTGHITYGR